MFWQKALTVQIAGLNPQDFSLSGAGRGPRSYLFFFFNRVLDDANAIGLGNTFLRTYPIAHWIMVELLISNCHWQALASGFFVKPLLT